MKRLLFKHHFLNFLILISIFCTATFATESLHSRYISHALQGRLHPILGELQVPNNKLTDGDRELVTKFQDRFGPERHLKLPNTKWPFINEIIHTYREYWIEVLLGEFSEEQQEKMIIARVDSVLLKHRIELPDSLGSLEAVSLEFKKLGVQALTGRTLPHFDLLAWAGNEPQDYQVELTDGPVDVRVYFMSDFVSYGWSHYATFGVAYPGGWAGSDALYCMNDDYDRASEKFNVSYLKHEGRHYADYKIFPKLTSTDLEYRGKLTELIYAEETLIDIIKIFISHAARDSKSPHSLANHEVVRQMSRAVFDKDFVSDSNLWQDIERSVIHQEAAILLSNHTRDLTAAGADTVQGLIVP